MSKTIPSEFPAIPKRNFTILEDINSEDWRNILRAQNREFSERGTRIPGMWPTNGDITTGKFQTSVTSHTTVNSSSTHHWDFWAPVFSLQRDLNSAGSEVLIIEYEAYVRDIEVILTFKFQDGGASGATAGTITVSSATGSTVKVSGSLSMWSYLGDDGGTLGNEPRSLTCSATGKALAANSTVWVDHLHEYRLTTTDTAKLPLGY